MYRLAAGVADFTVKNAIMKIVIVHTAKNTPLTMF